MTDFEPIAVTLVAPVDIDDVERELRELDRLRQQGKWFPAIQRACEAYVAAVEAEYERTAPHCPCCAVED